MYQCSTKLVKYEKRSCFDHLNFQHIQCLHWMYAEVAWVLVSTRTQVQPQIILDPDCLPDYLSVCYDYAGTYQPPSDVVEMYQLVPKWD